MFYQQLPELYNTVCLAYNEIMRIEQAFILSCEKCFCSC